MKLETLHLRDFLSYHEVTVDFPSWGSVSISGDNGAGKSSIPQAVAWILYGSPRASDAASVIRDFQPRASGQLTVRDAEGTRWRIERTVARKRGSSLSVQRWTDGRWVNHGDHLQGTARRLISAIAGMNEDAFRSLVFVDQSSDAGGTRFTNAKPTARRAIIHDLVPDLSQWSGWHDGIVERRREVSREVERTRTLIESKEDLKESLSEKIDSLAHSTETMPDREDLLARRRQITEAMDVARIRREEILAARRGHEDDLDRATHRLEQAQAVVRACTDRVDYADTVYADRHKDNLDRDDAKEERNELTDSITELESDIERHRRDEEQALQRSEEAERQRQDRADDLAQASAREASIRERLDNLIDPDTREARCPTCDAPLDLDHVAAHRDTIVTELEQASRDREQAAEAAKTAREQASKARRTHREAEHALHEAEKTLSECRADLKTLDAEIAQLNTLIDRGDDLLRDLADVDDDLDHAKAEETEARTALDTLESADDDGQDDQLRHLDTVLRSHEQDVADLDTDLGFVSDVESKISTTEELLGTTAREAVELGQQLSELTERLHGLDWLAEATSDKGAPALLVDSILADIETRQNAILDDIHVGDPMRVEFRQFRANKSTSGGKDVLDIIVHVGETERPLESFSFGERVVLSLSATFAMIDVFNDIHPGLVSTVFLDEPLGPLDATRTPLVLADMERLIAREVVDQLVVISHDPDVIDIMPHRVVVSRGADGTSQLELAS